jgi:hypothetical protein
MPRGRRSPISICARARPTLAPPACSPRTRRAGSQATSPSCRALLGAGSESELANPLYPYELGAEDIVNRYGLDYFEARAQPQDSVVLGVGHRGLASGFGASCAGRMLHAPSAHNSLPCPLLQRKSSQAFPQPFSGKLREVSICLSWIIRRYRATGDSAYHSFSMRIICGLAST